jgi:hypothetical protein
MNIFVLDRDPKRAARCLQDVHVGKMLVEACQLLCLCHSEKPCWLRGLPPVIAVLFDQTPYAATHKNHPCALWVRQRRSHYEWLVQHALALADEYAYRFGKRHGTEPVARWLALTPATEFDDVSDAKELEIFAQALPEKHRHPDAVFAYRRYYANDKRQLRGQPASWTRRRRPAWFDAEIILQVK